MQCELIMLCFPKDSTIPRPPPTTLPPSTPICHGSNAVVNDGMQLVEHVPTGGSFSRKH